MIGYIPIGFVPVYEAVARLADAWNPKLAEAPERVPQDPRYAPLMATLAAVNAKLDAPKLERLERQRRLDTYGKLRRVLAEGFLPSIIINESTGQRWPVPLEFWASSKANSDVAVSGTVSFHVGSVPISGTPIVEERDIKALAVGDPPPSLLDAIARIAAVDRSSQPQTSLQEDAKRSDPQSGNHRNVGGRPPKIDWDGFWIKIISIANTPDGLPERAVLKEAMAQWLENTGQEVGNTTLNDKLSRLYDGANRKPVSGG